MIIIISAIAGILWKPQDFHFFCSVQFLSWYWKIQIFCSAVSISVRFKFLKLPTTIQFSCDGSSEWQLCIRTPNSFRWSERMFVIMLLYAELLRCSDERVRKADVRNLSSKCYFIANLEMTPTNSTSLLDNSSQGFYRGSGVVNLEYQKCEKLMTA